MFLVHRRDVVEPVEVGQRLQVRFVFDQLLGSAVEQSDMRIDAPTTSPSSSSTRRRTPWAAGCWGPKLMVKLRTAASAIAGPNLLQVQRRPLPQVPKRSRPQSHSRQAERVSSGSLAECLGDEER